MATVRTDCTVLRRTSAGALHRYGVAAADAAAVGTACVAARTAAASGDTIEVYANGNVTESLAKDGVDWFLGPQCRLTRTDGAAGFLFDTGGAAMTFRISGFGSLARTFSSSPSLSDNTAGVLRVNHASANVRVEFNEISIDRGSGGPTGDIAAIMAVAGTLTLRGQKLRLAGDGNSEQNNGLWWENGEVNAHIIDMLDEATDHVGYLIYSAVDDTPTGDMRVRAERIQTTLEGGTITSISSQAEAAVWVDALTIKGGCVCEGGKQYITCQKLTGGISTVAGKHYITAQKMGGDFSGAARAFHVTNGGQSWIRVQQFEPGANTLEFATFTGGVHYLSADDITAATGETAIFIEDGTLNLLSGKITSDVAEKDLVNGGGTLNVVSGAVVGSGADGLLTTTGTITQLAGFA